MNDDLRKELEEIVNSLPLPEERKTTVREAIQEGNDKEAMDILETLIQAGVEEEAARNPEEMQTLAEEVRTAAEDGAETLSAFEADLKEIEKEAELIVAQTEKELHQIAAEEIREGTV